MSLAPLVSPLIRGAEGKTPERNRVCSVPGCLSNAQHGHHLWSRSFLRGQPYEWVKLPSGTVICNTTGLCIRHHEMVTGGVGGHKAWIRLEAGDVLVWYEAIPVDDWASKGALFPQPPATKEPAPGTRGAIAKAHVHLSEGETCSACGYTKPEKREALPARETASWVVMVPADAEIGGEVLDEWVEQFAILLGLDPTGKRLTRYHVLAVVMAWAMQNRAELIHDIIESKEAA